MFDDYAKSWDSQGMEDLPVFFGELRLPNDEIVVLGVGINQTGEIPKWTGYTLDEGRWKQVTLSSDSWTGVMRTIGKYIEAIIDN